MPIDVGILTVIPAELAATRAALGLADYPTDKDGDGTAYWTGKVESERLERPLSVALGCIGSAGNPTMTAAAGALINRHGPRVVILVGIAAGMRGKVRIGDVVLSERVVAYEPAALVRDTQGQSTTQHRPDSDRLSHSIMQDVVSYLSLPSAERIAQRFAALSGELPKAPKGKRKEYEVNVIQAIRAPFLATIASGEKLLRDPTVLARVRTDMHGKTEVGEMEAAGLVEACRRGNVPWLVIRGISDFGDELKNDAFHGLAAKAAAAVLGDFLECGLALDFPRARIDEVNEQEQRQIVVDGSVAEHQTPPDGSIDQRVYSRQYGRDFVMHHLPYWANEANGFICVDIDGMKSINDKYGKEVGDAVIRQLVDLAGCHPLTVRYGRYGDDTVFTVIRNEQALKETAEKLVADVSAFDWERLAEGLWVRCSAGYAARRTSEPMWGYVVRAESGMIRARKLGGNQALPGPLYLPPTKQTYELSCS